jgi:3-hydroxyacyl-CoA dehydrogenase
LIVACMSQLVVVSRLGDVAVVTIHNPPVNALSPGVPEGIGESISSAAQDPAVKAVVLIGAGRTFIAGADIKELEKAASLPVAGRGAHSGPDLHALLHQIEDCPKPVVMAIHGTALGGGLEVAMAGHFRVASPDAQLGQPEVNLGIIPGAEGTQRLPRLVGLAAAVDMCVSGKPVNAQTALSMGLIDKVVEGDLLAGAVEFARDKAAAGGPLPKTRERTVKIGENGVAEILAAGREQARKARRNQTAPLKALEALEAATLPFEQGWRKEREIMMERLASDQARALIHAFFAERAVSKIQDVTKDTPAYEIRKVAIVGAGAMGGGIAMACASAGIAVVLKEADSSALDRGMAAIVKNYEGSVKRGRFSKEIMEQRMALIRPQLSYDGFESADLILEAVFESMALKKEIFSRVGEIAKADCILATNTSTLDIDQIAAATPRPQMVVGLHFFNPANVMRLLEIVRGAATSKPVLATALALAKKLGKVGVVVGNCRGFVGNRMMIPYLREAQLLVEEGATPAQVDKALYDFGMAMGPFAVDDLGGIDVLWRVRQEWKHLEERGVRQPLVHDKLYQMGRLGQKSGKGWYVYDETRQPKPDPEVEALIESTARDAGIARRSISGQEIVERCIYALINEGARILEEGYAQRAADIDVIYLTGYGFPAYLGGPMWRADTVGLKKILDRILEFRKSVGEWWEPAPLLRKFAERGEMFAAWNAARS